MKTINKPIDPSLLYWITSTLAYCTVASIIGMPSYATGETQVDGAKLAIAVAAINKAKPGSDAHMQAAYDYCRIAIGATGMPVWIAGELKCRNLVDEAKK